MSKRKLYISKDLADLNDNVKLIADFIDRCNNELSIDEECDYSIYFVDNRKKHGIKTTAFSSALLRLIRKNIPIATISIK